MKTSSTRTALYSLAVLLTTSQMAYADGLDDNKVVRDSRGNIVHSELHGTCARTKWEEGANPCAVAPTHIAQPAPKPVMRTVLSQEDKTVYFGFDSAVLSDRAKGKLNDVAVTLQGAKDIQSTDIVGYTDSMGDAAYNRELSRKRAQTVKEYLASRGYLNTQVADVRGVGETGSLTDCNANLARHDKIACLSADRRVEVEIRYTTTEPTM